MDLTKIYLFRVSPTYPTREVFDKILYAGKENVFYQKEMPVNQALIACDTCYVEIANTTKTKWYPVTEVTMEAIVDAIDAATVPPVAESTVVARQVLSNYLYGLANDDNLADYGNRIVGNLGSVKVESDANISGVLYFVQNFEDYGGTDDEKIGYFLPIGILTTKLTTYSDVKIQMMNGYNAHTDIAIADQKVLFLGNTIEQAQDRIIQISGTVTATNEIEKIYLNIDRLKFVESISPYKDIAVQPEPETPIVG